LTERCGLEKVVELRGLKRLREPEVIDTFYSKRMRIIKLDDTNTDEHTRKLQVWNWAALIKQQKQRVSVFQQTMTFISVLDLAFSYYTAPCLLLYMDCGISKFHSDSHLLLLRNEDME
jgi:hypothetical protein